VPDPLFFIKPVLDPLFFQERGILAPTLDSVEHVNEFMMLLIPGEEK